MVSLQLEERLDQLYWVCCDRLHCYVVRHHKIAVGEFVDEFVEIGRVLMQVGDVSLLAW